jgi:hypothetical protein
VKRFLKFIKTPLGSLVAIVVFVLVGALLISGANRHEQPPVSVANTTPAPMERHTITRDGQYLKIPNAAHSSGNTTAQASTDPSDDTVISRPRAARGEQPAPSAKTRGSAILPISLLVASGTSPDSSDIPSSTYAPYGRLIPCETIITLESSKIETPIIGLVTEDVWHDGRLIIPAGAEVHGRAALDHARDRISASGQWVVVWRDRTAANGKELVVNGIALERHRDDVSGEYGLRDGSAGLTGQVLKSDNMQEIKLFASTFLAGMASGLQEMRDQTTAFGDVAQVPETSAKNAALQGTASVLNLYAEGIAKKIAEDGVYVRVPAGKQFYLYVTQTLDQAKAARGNSQAKLWQKTETNEQK